MKPPRDLRPSEFNAALRHHGFVPFPYLKDTGYRFTLKNGTTAAMLLRIRTAPIRRTTIRALVEYRDHLETLPTRQATTPTRTPSHSTQDDSP